MTPRFLNPLTPRPFDSLTPQLLDSSTSQLLDFSTRQLLDSSTPQRPSFVFIDISGSFSFEGLFFASASGGRFFVCTSVGRFTGPSLHLAYSCEPDRVGVGIEVRSRKGGRRTPAPCGVVPWPAKGRGPQDRGSALPDSSIRRFHRPVNSKGRVTHQSQSKDGSDRLRLSCSVETSDALILWRARLTLALFSAGGAIGALQPSSRHKTCGSIGKSRKPAGKTFSKTAAGHQKFPGILSSYFARRVPRFAS